MRGEVMGQVGKDRVPMRMGDPEDETKPGEDREDRADRTEGIAGQGMEAAEQDQAEREEQVKCSSTASDQVCVHRPGA